MTSQQDKDAAITKGVIPPDSFRKYAYDGGLSEVEAQHTNADDTMLTPVSTPGLTPDLTAAGTPESILSEPPDNFEDEAARMGLGLGVIRFM